MQKLTNFFRKNIFVLIIILISIPTFYRMFASGIYSMQDFHLFRLFEFDKCVKSWQIPCRWAPDAGLGYGEPLFNFYGQLSYAIGEMIHLIGFSFIDSLKILFIFSVLGSGVSMYFLAKRIWKDNFAALISSTLYIFAPYRAVDVWVRGILPEALSFVLFPLIILSIEEKSLVGFTILFSALILTHNLSALMFLPFLVVWIVYRKRWKFFLGFIYSFLISAFYILPIIFESKFVNLQSTIQGYFDYRGHFVTLYQLLISRFWGYGASVFGPSDGLSLSIGQIQWFIPLLIFVLVMIRSKFKEQKDFLLLFILGWFFLFLTHNKSTFLWNLVPQMAYIQFPWRFLGVATFSFAISSGAVVKFFTKQKLLTTLVIIGTAVVINLSFFREDIWYKVGDSYFTSGAEWDRQRAASIGDFWPNFGHKIPSAPSDGKFINYFPGWIGAEPKEGLIPSSGTKFSNTPVRLYGNTISLLSILGTIYFLKKWKEKH